MSDYFGFDNYPTAIETRKGSTVANVMLRQLREAAGLPNVAMSITPTELWQQTLNTVRDLAQWLRPRPGNGAEQDDTNEPIPMRLTCPMCGLLHVDQGEFATKRHHTHACQGCGMVWRPAVLPTVGVEFLPGFKDEGTEQPMNPKGSNDD